MEGVSASIGLATVTFERGREPGPARVLEGASYCELRLTAHRDGCRNGQRRLFERRCGRTVPHSVSGFAHDSCRFIQTAAQILAVHHPPCGGRMEFVARASIARSQPRMASPRFAKTTTSTIAKRPTERHKPSRRVAALSASHQERQDVSGPKSLESRQWSTHSARILGSALFRSGHSPLTCELRD